ncbi:energy-coupling factor transporter transmembrane component T [Corynebacterium sp. Marseille-P3884]|uniref:energy-coupling factor transporter transmembrane component T family protein n=1 Tax=Corynebacterium sp. Marseille-P3884 TaxID=2495409 RepID=UPI001B344BE3|nr:energy-coupling factor transporter transmembrane component T [Corynebacterium sp. Marseille-P3884]MBP3948783.1 energy-coupling factor transporter transmembrane protein EcfT [Corynebacterium sp. Marseille-P3884]
MGVYVPGTTPVHRASPATKFAGLLLFIILITVLPTKPWHPLAAAGGVAVLYAVAKIPLRTALRQVLPILPFMAFIGAFLWWQNGLAKMLITVFGLIAALMAASLFTLTTTIEDLMEALETNMAPLERIGVPVDTISLAIALTIRQIPVLLGTANESLDARKARGANLSLLAFGTPLVIRSVRHAQLTGEALMARGAVD